MALKIYIYIKFLHALMCKTIKSLLRQNLTMYNNLNFINYQHFTAIKMIFTNLVVRNDIVIELLIRTQGNFF